MSSLLRTENGLTTDIFVVKCTGRGLVVKRPGVLSKVQMLTLVLGVGVFSLLPRLGLCQRLGYPAPGMGQRCGKTPPRGKQLTHILDPHGRRAACCTKGLHTRRHDRTRNLLTKLARQAEQAMLIPDQILSDGQPAPGSVRPIHRADIHIR